jgi:AAA family ATP:ADP antiporter
MSFLNRIVAVERDEVGPMLLAALYYFLLFAAYFIIRPIRDEMGVAGGVRNLSWLFLGTLLGMLLIHPLFTALVSRLPRRLFIPLAYTFFVSNLVVFWYVLKTLSGTPEVWAGRVFFIWTSVFNLFVVSIFWSLMADLFRPDQAKRLFGFVAVGGTVGAVVGSSVTAFFAERITPNNLLLVSASLLGLAMLAAHRLMRTAPRSEGGSATVAGDTSDLPVGGGVLDGIRTALSSPYLLGIVCYMLLYTITGTLLYFQQAEIVEAGLTERAARTVFFARVDLVVNSLTAILQIFFTGRIVRRIGIALSLAVLPLICILGFVAVGIAPTLVTIAVVQVLRRSGNYAVSRPCREMLYTVLPRDAKYKAKNFIDTFVYRFGDQTGAWSYDGLVYLGFGAAAISMIAAPLAAVWLAIGLWLGHRQVAMVRTSATGQTIPDGG